MTEKEEEKNTVLHEEEQQSPNDTAAEEEEIGDDVPEQSIPDEEKTGSDADRTDQSDELDSDADNEEPSDTGVDESQIQRSEDSKRQGTLSRLELIDDLKDLELFFGKRYPAEMAFDNQYLDVKTRLTKLRRSIETNRLQGWVGVNLHETFGLDNIAERLIMRRPSSMLVMILEWIRNAGVLLPLLVTWVALLSASRHYKEFLETATSVEKTSSFLALWEQGFNGTGMRFSTVALIDVMILFVIILLTIGIHFLRDFYEPQAADDAKEKYRLLDEVLWKASLLIANFAQRQTVEGNLRESLDTYRTHAEEILNTIAIEQKHLRNLLDRRQTTSRLTDLSANAKNLDGAVRQTRRTYESLDLNAKKLTQVVEQFCDQHGTLLESIQKSQDGWQELGVEIKKSIRDSLGRLTEELGDAIADGSDAAGETSKAASAMSRSADALVKAQTELTRSLDRANRENSRLAQEMKQTAEGLKDVAEKIDTGQKEVTKDMEKAINDLRQANTSLVNAAQDVAKAARGLERRTRRGCLLGWLFGGQPSDGGRDRNVLE